MNSISKNTDTEFTLKRGKRCKISKNILFYGEIIIEDDVIIESHCIIKNSIIKSNTHIKPYTTIEKSNIGENCNIGPYANIRPNTILGDNVDIGNYVEIKNSSIGKKVRINHMSFIGDTVIKEEVTIGAGTITCNHDGSKTNKIYIDSNAYIGSGTRLIAPLIVGKSSTIGAGSVIIKNVPPDKLTISRSKQITIKNWKKK